MLPQTRCQAAQETLDHIQAGVRHLTSHAGATELADPARAQPYREAAAGAAAYAEILELAIEDGEVHESTLMMAELVATAANSGGWVSASVISGIFLEAAADLMRLGVLVRCAGQPDQWLPRYRLVGPA